MPDKIEHERLALLKIGGTRRLSPFDAWCLAIGCIIGWGAFSMPASTFLPAAGPLGTAASLIVAAAVIAVIALNYHYMVQEAPVEGGAYAYAARTFGHRHGFICAWSLILAYLALVPYNTSALALIERDLFGGILEIGPHYTLFGYSIYGVEIAVEIAVIMVAVLLIGRGRRSAGFFQMAVGSALVVCVVAVALSGLGVSAANGVSASPFFSPDKPAWVGVLSVLAVAPWAFVGFDAIPQAMSSMAFPKRKVGTLMISAIVVAAFMYIGLNTITALGVPEGYASWVEFARQAPEHTGLMSQPTFYAAYALLGQPGYVALEVAVICAVVMGIVGFSFLSSRLLCLMGEAGSLPKWFSVRDENGSPVNALLLVAIVSVIAVLVGRTALSWVVDVSSVGAAIAFAYTSAAAFVHARARQSGVRMALGAIGAVLSLVFVVLLLAPVPGLGAALGAESYVVLVTWIALGINFYSPATEDEALEPGAVQTPGSS